MFAPYTPLDKCVGKELKVRFDREEYQGLLAGLYTLGGSAIMVLTPLHGAGAEIHIPVAGAVTTLAAGG